MSAVNKSLLSNSLNWVRTSYNASPVRVISIIAISAIASLAALVKIVQEGMHRYSQYKISQLPALTFRFATWNVGDTSDYLNALKKYEPSVSPISLSNQTPAPSYFELSHEARQEWDSARIPHIKARIGAIKTDIIALQKISRHDLELLESWFNQQNLTCVSDGRETAILYRNDKFTRTDSPIPDNVLSTHHGLYITLQENETARKITVGSAHITRFDFDKVEEPYRKNARRREYQIGDRELSTFVHNMTAAAAKLEPQAILFGINANSDEITHPERLNIPVGREYSFTRNSAVNDGKTTAYKPTEGEFQSDHIFSRQVNCNDVKFTPDPLPKHILAPSMHKIVSGTFTIRYTD